MKKEQAEPKEKGLPVWVVAVVLLVIVFLVGRRIYKLAHLTYEERAFHAVVNYIDNQIVSTNPQIPKYEEGYAWKTREGNYKVEIPIEETTTYGITNTYIYEASVLKVDENLFVEWCRRKAED